MKNFEDVIPLIFGVVVAIALFLGIVKAIKKSLNVSPPSGRIDSKMILKEQQRHTDDVQQRQKELMRNQKQRIRDLKRQY